MLEAENLSCIRGDRELFRGLSFSLRPGTLLQVTGANGSGKTSLLRMICGLLEPAAGKIRWNGENIRSLGEEYLAALTYLGHRNGVKDELSALENLRITSGLNGIEISEQAALDILQQMGLSGRERLPARSLSEGQRRRAALARLSVCRTALWILDEVLTSLDKSAVALVRSLLESHLSGGGMALLATHQDLDLSAGSFQRIELAL